MRDAIQIQIGGEPSTLDPTRVVDQYGFGIMANVMEGLFRLDGDGHLQDGLATSHEVSKDGLTYRFHLRADAKWSDGQAVTADDFVFGLRRLFDPKTASLNAEFLLAIRNSRDVFFGKKSLESLGVRREGDDLVIELERPDPALLYELSFPCASPLRKDVFDAAKGVWSFRFPVTGEYRISEYHPSDLIELTPNPHNNRHPGRAAIRYRILPEEITAMNLFETGRLDLITTVTLTEIDQLRKKGMLSVVPSTTVFYISFNVSRPPFDDVEWRRAVAASVNRDEIARVLNGAFVPTTSYLPPNIAGALPFRPMEAQASVEKIRALKSKPRLKLAFGSSAFTRIVTEKLQYDLEKKLGLKVELQPMELKTLLGRLKSDPPDMYILGMSALFDDPGNQLNAFMTTTEPNFSRYKSVEYERLVAEMRAAPQGKHKTELAEEANRVLSEKDVVVVPFVVRNQVFGVSKKLSGFQVSPFQVIQLGALRK